MRSVAPRTGAREVAVAEEQEEYMPITVAMYRASGYENAIVRLTRWTFTPEERARVANGEDIYIGQLSHEQSAMTPLMVQCGAEGWIVNEEADGNAS